MPNWTEQQQDVIFSESKKIICSAAAGSGKTAVMIERIVQMIMREDRPEPDSFSPIRQLFGNDIIRILEAAADSRIAEFIKIPVQLQDHARPDGNKVIVFVDRIQHITITGDLAFAPALWGRLVHHDLF